MRRALTKLVLVGAVFALGFIFVVWWDSFAYWTGVSIHRDVPITYVHIGQGRVYFGGVGGEPVGLPAPVPVFSFMRSATTGPIKPLENERFGIGSFSDNQGDWGVRVHLGYMAGLWGLVTVVGIVWFRRRCAALRRQQSTPPTDADTMSSGG